MYLGEVMEPSGLVFDNLKLHKVQAAECEHFAPFYNGLDFGFAVPPDACVRWLQELTEIVIDLEHCANTAREFSNYEYQQDRYGNFMMEYPDINSHLIDATRYVME